jgi:hypothetical protein
MYPDAPDIFRGIMAAFATAGIDPRAPDAGRYFDQVDVVLQRLGRVENADFSATFDESCRNLLKMVDELADGLDNAEQAGDQAAAAKSRQALDAVKDYLALATQNYARSRNLTPPDPASFPRTSGTGKRNEVLYDTAAYGYTDWWSRNSGLGSGSIAR